MKIGIDARFFGPDSKGLGRYTQKLIEHLEDVDCENEYVIFLRENNFDEYVPKNKKFTKVKADYRWYSFAEQIFFPFVLYKQKCDFVHFPHFNVPVLYFGKFMVTIHDLILLYHHTKKASTRNAFVYWIKYIMYRFVIFSAITRASRIIAVSEFTKSDICNKYEFACDKIDVVKESAEIVDTDIKDSESIIKKYGIMNKYMLYVGNAYPHKNLYKLVDAFDKYVKSGGTVKELILVGKNDYFYNELKLYINKYDVKGVNILSTVTDKMLFALYKESEFFVFPSLYEGFGLPPLEAQLLSVPVLSSEHACMREILSDNGALYCDVENVEEFADAMKTISNDNELRKRLVQDGYKNAKKYSWQKMAQEIHDIYTNKI
ncbi:MAG: glycosyltransferase family 4 protein [Candidatus Moraniibacteriota bacterium]|jgi:glycosyltransferase involved in cell wall biosynthesis